MGLVRLALAIAVLLGHLPLINFKFMSAGLAVQAFFIVSGFYMSLVLTGKYRDLGLFYSNRLLRLVPSYFVVMALSAVAIFALNASATTAPEIFWNALKDSTTTAILAIENLAVVGQELLFWFTIDPHGALVFDPSGALPSATTTVAWQALLVPQSWSLSMELMFYCFVPLLVRLRSKTLLIVAGASIALRLAGYLLPVDYGIWQGRFFPTALFLFVLGILAQRLLPIAARTPKALGWLLNIGLLALIVALPVTHLPNELSRWMMYGLIALAMPFIFHAFSDLAFDRWIGDLSYPLYLSHLLVIGLVLTFNPPMAVWLAIGGSLALSMLLLIWIDHPIDRWRQRRAAKSA